MPWGIAAAAVVGAVGSTVAAGEQASGQQQAAQTQQNMFNTINAQEQPFIQGGQGAETELGELLGYTKGSPGNGLKNGYLTQQFNPTQAQLNNYPGYQFQLQQGDQAVTNAQAASGGAISGAALKSLSGFNQGLAASNYQNYFNQFQTQQNNIFNRLSGIAGIGQNAAGNLGNSGAQLGTGIAQAQAGAAASYAGGIQGASSSIGNGLMLSSLMNNNSGGGSGGNYWYNGGNSTAGLALDG